MAMFNSCVGCVLSRPGSTNRKASYQRDPDALPSKVEGSGHSLASSQSSCAVPSGNDWHSCRKSPFWDAKSLYFLSIFHSYFDIYNQRVNVLHPMKMLSFQVSTSHIWVVSMLVSKPEQTTHGEIVSQHDRARLTSTSWVSRLGLIQFVHNWACCDTAQLMCHTCKLL